MVNGEKKEHHIPGRSVLANRHISALIISRNGPLLGGLRELLNALPQVHLVGVVEEPEAVSTLLETDQRALILLDNSLHQNDVGQALHVIKDSVPNAICMVIVGDVEHRTIALQAGADWVELTGFPAEALYREFKELLTI